MKVCARGQKDVCRLARGRFTASHVTRDEPRAQVTRARRSKQKHTWWTRLGPCRRAEALVLVRRRRGGCARGRRRVAAEGAGRSGKLAPRARATKGQLGEHTKWSLETDCNGRKRRAIARGGESVHGATAGAKARANESLRENRGESGRRRSNASRAHAFTLSCSTHGACPQDLLVPSQ